MRSSQFIKRFCQVIDPLLFAGMGLLQANFLSAAPQKGPVLSKGAVAVIRNLHGGIQVAGWDKDWVEVEVVPEKGNVSAGAKISPPEGTVGEVLIQPDPSTAVGEVKLKVQIPRFVQLKAVEGNNGDISVKGIEGAVHASSNSGNILIDQTGEVTVHSSSGDVSVAQIQGAVSVATQSGDIKINSAGPVEVQTQSGDVVLSGSNGSALVQTSSGDMTVHGVGGNLTVKTSSGDVNASAVQGRLVVNAVSSDVVAQRIKQDAQVLIVSGDVVLECVGGRTEAGSTSGEITLTNVRGDVDAHSASGDIRFSGVIKAGGRYRLKSNSGSAHMTIPENSPGFLATLSSYSGSAETDFPLTLEPGLQRGSINNRITGKFGDGGAQITLDSFSAEVKLRKASSHSFKQCEE
jgi:DUF4097 and DUF4098 domain-containing protein YvlB